MNWIYFHESLWKLPWKYMEISAVGRSGRFHCFHQLQLVRTYSVEVFMSFHIPLHMYFHLLPRVSQTSSCLHKTNPNRIRTLTLTLSWSYLHGSWPTSKFHGRTWKQVVASMEAGATCMETGLVPTSMDVDRSCHGIGV